MTDRNVTSLFGRETDRAERSDGSLSPTGRAVELRVRYWGLLLTPVFERCKRRYAAGWGLDLRVFTESAMLDIMLMNIAHTYRRMDWCYVHVPLNSEANPSCSTGDPGSRERPEAGDSKVSVKVFDQVDAFVGELVRRWIAGDPARSRTERLSEYGRMAEIRQDLVQRHKGIGTLTDSQIVDVTMAVFHGVESGRCQLSRSRRDLPKRPAVELRAGDPRGKPGSGR